MQTKTSNILIYIVSHEEHVPESEINIRTFEDYTRSTLESLHFQRIPNGMLIELAFGQLL